MRRFALCIIVLTFASATAFAEEPEIPKMTRAHGARVNEEAKAELSAEQATKLLEGEAKDERFVKLLKKAQSK